MSINDDLLPEMIAPPPKLEQNIKVTIKDPDFPDPDENEVANEDTNETESVEDSIESESVEVEVSSEDEIIPEPKKRVVIPKKDIFKSVEPSDVPKLQKVKQKRKPRGPASEKQLETLARARAKGIETRRKKAEEKRKIKELEDKIKQQEIEEKKKSLENKLNKVTSVKKQVFKEEEVVEPKVVESKALSSEDAKKKVEDTIEKAVAKGIAEFEMKRKERKLEKKKRLEKEAYDKKVLNTVHKAVSPDDYWAQCFR